jgi:hypothetical protein
MARRAAASSWSASTDAAAADLASLCSAIARRTATYAAISKIGWRDAQIFEFASSVSYSREPFFQQSCTFRSGTMPGRFDNADRMRNANGEEPK